MRTLACLALAMSWLGGSIAFADPARPSLKVELPQCKSKVGPDAVLEAATNYPGGLSSTGNGLTPATAPGVTTVSAKLAACLVEALGSELVVIAAVDDNQGLPGAVAIPWAGTNKPLEGQDLRAYQNTISILTDGRTDRPILVYCHHIRCFPSYNASIHLKELGYTNILWLREGMAGWKAIGEKFGRVDDVSSKDRYPDEKIPSDVKPFARDPLYPRKPGVGSDAWYAPLKEVGLDRQEVCASAVFSPAPEGSGFHFEYQRLLGKAAGVDPERDNEVAVRRKMQRLWSKVGHLLDCDGLSSTLREIAGRGWEGTADIIAWGLPLNDIDTFEGNTLLDSVADLMVSGSDVDRENAPRAYKAFRHAGALHCHELEASGAVKRREVLQAEFIAQHEIAAGNGDLSSLWYLANVFQRGAYVPKNVAHAQRYYDRIEELALVRRDNHTLNNLAFFYSDPPANTGRVPDRARAFRLFTAAAENGDGSGMIGVGKAHYSGTVVKQDYAAALGWFKRAYDAGETSTSPMWLGRTYIKLGDVKAAEKCLRMMGQRLDIEPGLTVEDWFERNNLPLREGNVVAYGLCTK
jgi:rhodanese-related sulfurtransferase